MRLWFIQQFLVAINLQLPSVLLYNNPISCDIERKNRRKKIDVISPDPIVNIADEDFSQADRGLITCTVIPKEGYSLYDNAKDFELYFGEHSGYSVLKVYPKNAEDGSVKVLLVDTSVYKMKKPSFTYAKNKSSKKIVLKWKKDSEANGYYIKYKRGKKSKTVKISSNSTVTKTLKKLKKGQTYKVYIRSYTTVDGKRVYSSWSSGKKIKIKR